MGKLVVAVFESEGVARDALVRAAELRANGHVEIEDACLVARHEDGSVHIRETSDISPWKASAYGSAWGLVCGALVGLPLAGAAVSAALAAGLAKHRDAGITDEFEQEVATRLAPGRSAVVVHVRADEADAVAKAAEGMGAWTTTADVHGAHPDWAR